MRLVGAVAIAVICWAGTAQALEAETASSPPPSQIVDPVVCNCVIQAASCTPGRKFDGYFIPRYMLPFTPGVGLMSGDVEAGWIWGKGSFFGIEAGLSYYITDNWERFTLGIGFNWGAIRELPQIESQIAYGVFTGIWSLYDWKRTGEQVREVYQSGSIGPFARLRWRGVEFSYRGIIGYKQIETYTYGAYYSDNDVKYDGFGIIHQFMVGLHYFDSSKGRR
jgi:hypothetical protein